MNGVRYGGLEAGGTKMVCAIGDEMGNIEKRKTFQTKTPQETMPEILRFFRQENISALGVGSFGPLDLNEGTNAYGSILNTPKKPWVNFPLLHELEFELKVPIKLTTDVNAAALAETKVGAAQGLDSCLYMTVGTGIGVGAVVNGQLLHGYSHPEMGHIFVRKHEGDGYPGLCSYHGDCLEGLASGPAIKDRWGMEGETLVNDQGVWELESYYLGQAIYQFILTLMPKKIVLGGGVMKQESLFPAIHDYIQRFMGNYVSIMMPNEYIVSPKLGDDAGVIGGLLLANEAKMETERASDTS